MEVTCRGVRRGRPSFEGGIETIIPKRVSTDAVLAARRPYAMRFALNYPAPDARGSNLKDHPGLPRRQKLCACLADWTRQQRGAHHNPLTLESDDLDSSLHRCLSRMLMGYR